MKIKLSATICILFFMTFVFLPNNGFAQRTKVTKTQAKPIPPKRELNPPPGVVNMLPINVKRYALIVGVDQYEDTQISKLEGATNDAKTLAEALTKNAGFLQNQVKVLTNDQSAERRPTRANILRSLSNLTQTMPKDGLLLISFAGHGIERDGKAFLLPSDAQLNSDINLLEDTALPAERISDLIKKSGIKQVLILLDACRSNLETGRSIGDQPLSKAYTNSFNFDVRNNQVTAFAVLYATGKGQTAYEYNDKKQGYFSWALVEGLKGKAINEKGEVTLSSLLKFLEEIVPKQVSLDIGKPQVPFAVIEGYKADELVLAFYPIEKKVIKPEQTSNVNNSPNSSGDSSDAKKQSETNLKKYHPLLSSAKEKYAAKDYGGAISDLTQAIALDPNNSNEYKSSLATVYFQRGITKYQQANFEGGISDITQAIQISPNSDASMYNARGVMKTELKRYEEAVEDFNKAVEINPNLADVYVNRGDAYKRRGDRKKSDQDYEKAKQIDPNTYTPNSNPTKNPAVMARVNELIVSGQNKANQGNYDGAINDFTQAINLNPKYPTAFWLRGNAKLIKEFIVGALIDYQNAASLGKLTKEEYQLFLNNTKQELDKNPQNVSVTLNQILLHFGKGECRSAESEAKQSIKAFAKSYLAQIIASIFADSPKEAMKYLDKALSLKSDSATVYFMRYIASNSQNKKKEADAELKKALIYSTEDANLMNLFIKRSLTGELTEQRISILPCQ